MRSVGIVLVAAVMAGLAGGCSSSSSPTGCATVKDAEAQIGVALQQAQAGAETPQQIAAQFGSLADKMRNVSLIASGDLKTAAADAEIQAGRLGVAFSEGRRVPAVVVSSLRADVGTIHSVCGS